jgi:hypothetical protein
MAAAASPNVRPAYVVRTISTVSSKVLHFLRFLGLLGFAACVRWEAAADDESSSSCARGAAVVVEGGADDAGKRGARGQGAPVPRRRCRHFAPADVAVGGGWTADTVEVDLSATSPQMGKVASAGWGHGKLGASCA